MFFKKKIVPLLLVLALMPAFLSVPVSAADYSDESSDGSYNLLTSKSYNMYRNGVVQAKGIDFPNRYVSSSSKNLAFEWTPGTSINHIDVVYFTLFSSIMPSKVEFQPYSGRVLEAVYLGKYGSYAQYKVDLDSDIGALTIRAYWNNGYSGSFGVLSCTGLLTGLSQSISSFDLYAREMYSTSDFYTKYLTIENDTDLSVPYVSWKDSVASGNYALESDYYITLPPDSHVYDYLDYFEFSISTWGDSEFSACTVDEYGTPIQVLDSVSVVSCWRTILHDNGMEWPLLIYTIRVYLRGMDLSSVSLQLHSTTQPYISETDVSSYYFGINSIIYKIHIDELPWYQIFYRWINSSIVNVGDSIVSAINSLVGVFGNNGELQQAGEAMSNQASSMQAANNQLNSVEKPSFDTGQLLDNFLNFNTGGMTILSSMTNNSFVPQLMVVVFTFALCGYIFFGKKG